MNHLKMECNFINIGDFFVVNVLINKYGGTINVNINDYYNKKTK